MNCIGEKKRILVVDDVPENIWALIETLETAYDVIYATSGEEALDTVFSNDLPDVILLDIVMPGMDGYEVLQRLKADKRTSKIPVIFLTGKSEEEDETEGFRLGAWDYITKPFSMPVVHARIQSVINLKCEMDRRLFLKRQMENLNSQLEHQVQQKMAELQQAKEALKNHDERYRHLFERKIEGTTALKKILIVDDNPENIHVLSDSLENDYEVMYATSGEEALKTIFSGDRPDLILLDIMMPGMDGYEVCARLKANAETWDIPVIFITAMNQVDDETKGLKLGAMDYIAKPFSMAVVRARISNALHLKDEMDRRILLTRKLREMNQDLENRVNEKVTELKEIHENLKKSESRYRSIFENAVEGIYQSTPEGRLINASLSMAQILGYDSPEQLISSITDVETQCYVDPDDRKALLKILLREGITKGFETRMRRKDGEVIWVSLSARSVCDDQGKFQYTEGFCADITKQKTTEEALMESEKRLRQSQKMEALGTLAGGIAHDFNNILFSMTGYSEMILKRLAPESKEHIYIKEVLKAGHRARELVRQILSFSRQTVKEKKPVFVNSLIKEVLKLLSSAFPSTIEIKQNIQSNGWILADPVEIHQVVMNLCTNALHAMQGKKGILEVSLKDIGTIPQDSEISNSSETVQDARVRLEVRDTGSGMPPEILDHIFEPYFTTKNKDEGTGLGLATVYGIVKELGGDISVKSRIGQGSIFTIDFIRMEKKRTQWSKEAQTRGQTVSEGMESVLLVDGERIVCEMLSKMLKTLGYRVHAYTSSDEALAVFQKRPEAFDILLTDLEMPTLSGLTLAGRIRNETPRMPVVILSGSSDPIHKQNAAKLGFHEFIKKPIDLDDLAKALRRALSPDKKTFI